jgi:hypothetical protein
LTAGGNMRARARVGGFLLLVVVVAVLAWVLLRGDVDGGPVGTTPSQAHTAHGLRLGLSDSAFLADGAERDPWLDRARSAGARVIRLGVNWADVAPSAGVLRWERVDAAVRAAAARSLDVLLSFAQAPAWAEGPNRPPDVAAGAWEPDPVAFGAFARAAAERYSGAGANPRVRFWQPWNEPNLARFLAPQWTRRGDAWQPSSPQRYRRIHSAFASAVKRVHASNVVVSAGTAPFGDPAPGGKRMAPVRFLDELLQGPRLTLDAIDHHPYAVGPPEQHARNPDDVSIPDLGKLRRVLTRHGYNATHLWVSELGYDSNPPDPDGVPEARHARWLVRALRIAWEAGADTALWYQVRDDAPDPQRGFPGSNQSGLYLRDGKPKLAMRAFRFPFNVRDVRSWGVAPRSGMVLIEQRSDGAWRSAARVRVRAGQVFQATMHNAEAPLRASMGGLVSLPTG